MEFQSVAEMREFGLKLRDEKPRCEEQIEEENWTRHDHPARAPPDANARRKARIKAKQIVKSDVVLEEIKADENVDE